MIKDLLLKTLPGIVLLASAAGAYAQSDSALSSSYEGLSLKDLLNERIVSVSKKAEYLFDAPLSASVITRDDIRRAGCTSIMEALRLAPGMIVREQSNGNYDIHLRGTDNVPPNASFDIAATTTLVMIDSRPIYSYLRGGTFWETLPVDLNDVERIEVVRGPAAALYGPNAVNGVINIITRQIKKDGLSLTAAAQRGSYQTHIGNASLGYQSAKWSALVSGNYQARNRTQTSYYEFTRDKWLDNPDYFINFQNDTVRNISARFPDPDLAMKKYGGNAFISYRPKNKITFNLSAGIQDSRVQKVSAENENTPLSTASSQSRYVDLRANIVHLTTQVSYVAGTQNVDYDPGNEYDFSTFDANMEYNYTVGKLSIKPGLRYSSAVYDDTKYSDTAYKRGIFNARGEIISRSASLRGEYKLLDDQLRLVTGLMATKFNYPDEVYLSYQFAATYKLTADHLFRAVYSRAPRSSNIFDTYVDQRVAFYPSGFHRSTDRVLAGNKNLKLLTADMFEVGYRTNISPKLHMDVELFDIRAKNFNIMASSRPSEVLAGADTITILPIITTNLPLRFIQQGATVSLSYNAGKWMAKPFVTIQKTRIEDYAPYPNTPDAGLGPNNIYSGLGNVMTLKSTPSVFGGASVNYAASRKFNANISAYYYSSQTYYHLANVLLHDGVRGIDHIDAKLIINASISFEPVKGLTAFTTGKNLLNDPTREFFKSDRVPLMLFAGLRYEL